MKPAAPALEARSLNHWTAMEIVTYTFLGDFSLGAKPVSVLGWSREPVTARSSVCGNETAGGSEHLPLGWGRGAGSWAELGCRPHKDLSWPHRALQSWQLLDAV